MAASPETIRLLMDALQKWGVTNTYVQAGVVSVIGTESNYVPKTEVSYRNTPNDRIRAIFGYRLAKYTEPQLTALKSNDVSFFDSVYGGQYGNNKPGDGYKYRGRGFNGITFYDNYLKYGKAIGVDLVANPDMLNQMTLAAAASAVYFADTLKAAQVNGNLLKRVGIQSLSEVKDFNTGVKVALQANAGFGKSIETSFYQEVYQKALVNLEGLYNTVKSNPIKAAGIVVITAAIFFLGYQLIKQTPQ